MNDAKATQQRWWQVKLVKNSSNITVSENILLLRVHPEMKYHTLLHFYEMSGGYECVGG